jgi:hypothetical protein
MAVFCWAAMLCAEILNNAAVLSRKALQPFVSQTRIWGSPCARLRQHGDRE